MAFIAAAASTLALVLTGCGSAEKAETKGTFDYTFGANCPYCRQFGEELKTVFVEDNVATDIHFNFRAAIRYNKTFLVDGKIANDTMYQCPDEGFACPGTVMDGDKVVTYDDSCGCPYTEWVECAMNKAQSQNQKVNFMSCWDDSTISDKVQNATTLEAFAQTCSITASLVWDDVKKCHDGDEKSQLLWAAANDFMDTWVNNTKMGGPFHVPHVLIGKGSSVSDLEDLEPRLNPTDYAMFNKALCNLGVEMPACQATITA